MIGYHRISSEQYFEPFVSMPQNLQCPPTLRMSNRRFEPCTRAAISFPARHPISFGLSRINWYMNQYFFPPSSSFAGTATLLFISDDAACLSEMLDIQTGRRVTDGRRWTRNAGFDRGLRLEAKSGRQLHQEQIQSSVSHKNNDS
jgi:hypothetical protein